MTTKLITLAVITGNCEEYIERFLKSFLPIADEVCLVRAIGNKAPDETLCRAKAVCDAAGVPLQTAEYNNAHEHSDWPHIDSFCAARQMSFDLATSQYVFWADLDDVLKSGAERIRQHAERGGYACFIFPYEIHGKNVSVPRERMMLKDAGRWCSPVHEYFRFKIEPVNAVMDDGVIVQHLPHLSKGGSNERNLRIIESIPEAEMTTSLKYHHVGELRGVGRIKEAVELAAKLVVDPALGKAERYELLMDLTLQTQDLEQRVALLHEAFKTDPLRREALGVLATTMIDKGQPEQALAYARQMAATLPPVNQEWNSRHPFYGYTGDEIVAQALRFNGLAKEAEAFRRKRQAANGGPRIALLHATRGRPVKASRCRKLWHDFAARPEQVEHIFAIDADDAESRVLKRFHHVQIPGGGGCVQAWNAAAGISEAPVMVQLSDDWLPVPNWDELILERLGDLSKPSVLAISDGHRKDGLLCMAICTRAHYEQDWFLFHPYFTGVFSDNWFTDEAYRRGAVIEARDVVFKHQHPVFGEGEMDDTYKRQNAPERYQHGQGVYELLKRGADWSSVPGFFNYWPFYASVAGKLKDGDSVVEIGCWLGRSIIFLAQQCQRQGKRVKFTVVDTFKGESNQKEHEATVREAGGSIRSRFEENIRRCGVAEMFTIIEGDSAASAGRIADGSQAFVFIDAAHDYESVKRDIAAWKPKLIEGGMLAGHDAQWPEVAQAVKELVPNALIDPPVWSVTL